MPSDSTPVIAAVVRVLQDLCRLDPAGLATLAAFRVPATPGVADHPAIQLDGPGQYGLLGILNAILSASPDGYDIRTRLTLQLDPETRQARGFSIRSADTQES